MIDSVACLRGAGMFPCALLLAFIITAQSVADAPGAWLEPRGNDHLTGVQSMPGAIQGNPRLAAEFDLGRGQPAFQAVMEPVTNASLGLSIVGGALYCHETTGLMRWVSHPPGLNFGSIKTVEDLDGDGAIEILLECGRPTNPFGASALVALDNGRLIWRYDVDPMSYAWYLYVGNYLPNQTSKQIIVVMHGYPPDAQNGYIALFEFLAQGKEPAQRWRYDFDAYTCFPSLLETDLEGDGVKELVIETHSRMWILDSLSGAVKQFLGWDVSPGNVRSYGLVRFVDINSDGLDDFLCIATFAQHHEVLLNKGGKMELAWAHGWPESVTTGKVATVWAEPPVADVDGDGSQEVILSMFNSENEAAWLVRVYDAVTGVLKYRVPGVVAESCVDVDADGAAEILVNATSDPTRTALAGVRMFQAREGELKEVWRDDTLTAIPPRTSEGRKAKNANIASADWVARVTRWDEKFEIHMSPSRAVILEPWEKPPRPAGPDFSRVPPLVGPSSGVLLAADLDSDGENELLLYQDPKLRVYDYDNGQINAGADHTSNGVPVFADLDGDSRLEMVRVETSPDAPPILTASTPSLDNKAYWRAQLPPPNRLGLPHTRPGYLRTARLTGHATPDLYLWTGMPLGRSVGIDGQTGQVLWEKGEAPNSERYWGATVNYASAYDYDGDGKEDVVFTNPDYYCVASGPTGEFLLGPLYPPTIFSQPSQGLYTFPAILPKGDGPPTICLVDGHYFQAAMSIKAEPFWYKLPVAGENRAACEGFLPLNDGSWLMGFGRQNGAFACINVADGALRWELPVDGTCSDPVTCDIDRDGQSEFIFGTSHGDLYCVGDGVAASRVLWQIELGSGCVTVIAADLDGDGASEIAVLTAAGYLQVFDAV